MPGFFDEVINSLVTASPDLVEKVPSSKDILQPKFSTSHTSSAYFQEVYMLAAMEAERRDLQYIWMDRICIDQTQPSDKEAEIPFMADYYRGADCCVVISELLLQKLCFMAKLPTPEETPQTKGTQKYVG
ncbi:hypothetical protein BDZ45DRAFT_725485 [Acephala macrosclerotiorum]|nr:hypothetical protein BDZ45DRAFT_725485 [Acephala macrosclerotiorum]